MFCAIYFIVYFLLVSTYLNLQLARCCRRPLSQNPGWAMTVASVLVFGLVAHRGVTGVARFFEVIGTYFVITATVTHFVMLLQGDLREIQPLFQSSKLPEYLLGIKDCLLAFLGIELLTVFPLNGKNIRRSVATAFLTLLFVGLFYVFAVETCIMLLGMKSVQNYSFALIEAIKQVDNPVLERFDILYLTVGFSGLVAGLCGVYLAVVEYATRVFAKVSRCWVVVGVGLVMAALSIGAQGIKSAADAFESALPIAGWPRRFSFRPLYC